jgi:hypothetical protein
VADRAVGMLVCHRFADMVSYCSGAATLTLLWPAQSCLLSDVCTWPEEQAGNISVCRDNGRQHRMTFWSMLAACCRQRLLPLAGWHAPPGVSVCPQESRRCAQASQGKAGECMSPLSGMLVQAKLSSGGGLKGGTCLIT